MTTQVSGKAQEAFDRLAVIQGKMVELAKDQQPLPDERWYSLYRLGDGGFSDNDLLNLLALALGENE